jgi:hypothetical protein
VTMSKAIQYGIQWSQASPEIAGAFANFAAILENASTDILHPESRERVIETISSWCGERMSLSRIWVEEALSGLPKTFQAEARLALLVALAPHQIDQTVIDKFRRVHPGDQELIETLAWGSFLAARRISTWLVPR